VLIPTMHQNNHPVDRFGGKLYLAKKAACQKVLKYPSIHASCVVINARPIHDLQIPELTMHF